MKIVAIRSPWHPTGRLSPLHGLHVEGLSAALLARGHHLVSTVVAAGVTDQDAFRLAVAHGQQQAAACSADGSTPDIWLCDGYLSALAGSVAAAGTGGRVVVWLGPVPLPAEERLYRLSAAVLRSAAAVIGASDGVARWLLRERLTGRVDVVHPAVDPALAPGPPAAAPGHCAELVVIAPVAGPGTSALRTRVLRLLSRADPDARVIVVPPGQRHQEEADVAVTGLGSDGGLGTLRAMARGLAVITLSGLPDRDLIEDRVSGLQAPDGRTLVSAVRELKRDPFLREALGQGAIDRVDSTLSTRRVAAALEERLGSVLARTPPAAAPLTEAFLPAR